MGVIFLLSAQPDLKSGLESRMDFVLRKIAHMAEYAILMFLAWRAAGSVEGKRGMKYLIGAIIFSFLYALSDEYHQTFVYKRVGSLYDVAIDSLGVLIMAVIVYMKKIRDKVSLS